MNRTWPYSSHSFFFRGRRYYSVSRLFGSYVQSSASSSFSFDNHSVCNGVLYQLDFTCSWNDRPSLSIIIFEKVSNSTFDRVESVVVAGVVAVKNLLIFSGHAVLWSKNGLLLLNLMSKTMNESRVSIDNCYWNWDLSAGGVCCVGSISVPSSLLYLDKNPSSQSCYVGGCDLKW